MSVEGRVLLPQGVRPKHYRLTLESNFDTFTFKGKEAVEIAILEETSSITLHALDLEISSAKVTWEWSTRGVEPQAIKLDPQSETVTFEFAEPLPEGRAILRIAFCGQLNDKMAGFYRSMYEVNGEKRWMGTTQFEPTDARRAFPCWDEPAQKARFAITLIVPHNLEALSNMPVFRNELVGPRNARKRKITFTTSPIMSTYLVAFCVGEFEYISAFTKRGVLVRVFTTPGKKEWGRFALDVAVKVTEFYEEYFGIDYPMTKMDLIAIPDFAAGAMENWGLITYRETALLIDPENSAAQSRQRVAIVVAHEIAHMWFGDLVTMDWWTGLWLNEGFATWMEYLATDHLFPEWEIWTQFLADDYGRALSDDGLRNTHPIEVEVKNPNEIGEIFDAISYSKGAAVIRMIESHLGRQTFRKGLQVYLNRHAYGNATTEDLWNALAEVSGQPVKEIMDSWTKQSGYPVVTLSPTLFPDKCLMRQARFLSSGEVLTDTEARQAWQISLPVLVELPHLVTERTVTLNSADDSVVMPIISYPFASGWVKFNYQQLAFLRVNYPPVLWERLKTAIADGLLPPVDRFGIANDLHAFVRAGTLPSTQALSVLEAYKNDQNYTVWTAVKTPWTISKGGILDSFENLLRDEAIYDTFAAFARTLLQPIVRALGWDVIEVEPHTQKLLRGLVLRAYGGYGDQKTNQEAQRRFSRYLVEPSSLDPDLRAAVYVLAAENGDEDTFSSLVREYRKVSLQEEKTRLLRALGTFRDQKLLRKALEFSFSPDVRAQDAFMVLGAVSLSHGRNLAWEFVKENWGEIEKRYSTGGLKLISYFVTIPTEGFVSEEKANEVEAFFAARSVPSANRAIQQSVERIRMNARWLERDRETIAKWLTDWAASQMVDVPYTC